MPWKGPVGASTYMWCSEVCVHLQRLDEEALQGRKASDRKWRNFIKGEKIRVENCLGDKILRKEGLKLRTETADIGEM